MEAETDDAEENGKHNKSTHLDRFSTDSIDGCDRHPIARNETSDRQNQIADTGIVQSSVNEKAIGSLYL